MGDIISTRSTETQSPSRLTGSPSPPSLFNPSPSLASQSVCCHKPGISNMPAPQWHRGERQQGPAASAENEESGLNPTQAPLPPPSNLDRPRGCINKFPTPAFSLLCTMMDRMRSEDVGKRRDTLTRFMNLWRIKVGNDMYPLIRLLLPDVSVNRGSA